MPTQQARTPRIRMPRSTALVAGMFIAVMVPATPLVALGAPPSQETLEARAHMLLEARESGSWIVSPGENLRIIARVFHPGDKAAQRELVRQLIALNPNAFRDASPDRLIPGARLVVPAAERGPGASPSPALPARRTVPAPRSTPGVSDAVSSAEPNVASAASGTTPIPEFEEKPPAPRPPPPPPAYVDQLIEGVPAETNESLAAAEAALSPGQRYISAEARTEVREPPEGGRSIEEGVQFQARRETLDFGDFFLDMGLRHTQLAPGDLSVDRRDGVRFTLYHQQFPLLAGWLADSALGVVRTPPSFVNNSYRIFLPTSLMGGASTYVSDGHQGFIAYGGRLGRLEGSAVQTFDATPGEMAGLGYERRMGLWTFGGQGVAVQGVPELRDHEAATLAAEYGANGDLVHHKAQIVADSDSHLGAWFDGDVTTGRLRQRFGLFNMDPGLEWADAPLQNDQRGAYWRGDYRMLRYTLSGGLDALQTNLRDDPERSALRSGTAYGTASLRIDRNLSIGGGLTYQVARTRFGGTPRSDVLSGNAYVSWTGPLGLSRFDATSYHGSADETPDTRVDNYSWSQEWPSWGPVRTSSTLTYSRENNAGVRTERSSVGLSGNGALYNGLTWDASVVYGRIQTADGNEHDFNVSATATWPFAAHWVGTAQVSVTTFDVLPALPGLDLAAATQHDKRVMLGVRYEAASGTPYQALGLRGGAGSGRIAGMVFYDENGDGLRQATERGAANVTVYLDGRFPVTTDSQGRFYYSVVTPGSHSLRILNESLQLPWSIDEDHPRVADVPLRGEIAVDIPLIKIRP